MTPLRSIRHLRTGRDKIRGGERHYSDYSENYQYLCLSSVLSLRVGWRERGREREMSYTTLSLNQIVQHLLHP